MTHFSVTQWKMASNSSLRFLLVRIRFVYLLVDSLLNKRVRVFFHTRLVFFLLLNLKLKFMPSILTLTIISSKLPEYFFACNRIFSALPPSSRKKKWQLNVFSSAKFSWKTITVCLMFLAGWIGTKWFSYSTDIFLHPRFLQPASIKMALYVSEKFSSVDSRWWFKGRLYNSTWFFFQDKSWATFFKILVSISSSNDYVHLSSWLFVVFLLTVTSIL